MSKNKPFTEEQIKALIKFTEAPDRRLNSLKDLLENLEGLRKDNEIPASYVAFEVLENLYGGLEEGYSIEDLLSVLPKEISQKTIQIPAEIIGVLLNGWNKYKKSDTNDMSKSFGMLAEETRRPAVSKLKQIIKEKRLVRLIIEEMWRARLSGSPTTLSQAIETVSEHPTIGVSHETIRKLWYKHRENFNNEITRKGLPSILG